MATQQKEEVSRQEIKDLIDGLPDLELHAVKRFIQYIRDMNDPVFRILAEAPWDDEPVSQEDLRAIAEANKDIAAGRVTSHEDLMREFGLHNHQQRSNA